jgi:hypothetical protein
LIDIPELFMESRTGMVLYRMMEFEFTETVEIIPGSEILISVGWNYPDTILTTSFNIAPGA